MISEWGRVLRITTSSLYFVTKYYHKIKKNTNYNYEIVGQKLVTEK